MSNFKFAVLILSVLAISVVTIQNFNKGVNTIILQNPVREDSGNSRKENIFKIEINFNGERSNPGHNVELADKNGVKYIKKISSEILKQELKKIVYKFEFFKFVFSPITRVEINTKKVQIGSIHIEKNYSKYTWKHELKSKILKKFQDYSNIYYKQNDSYRLALKIPAIYYVRRGAFYVLTNKSRIRLSKIKQLHSDLYFRLNQKIVLNKKAPKIIGIKKFLFKLS